MSLKGKLDRFRSHLTVESSKKERPPLSKELPEINIPHQKDWGQLQASPYFYEDNYVIVREVLYPMTHQHGHYSFANLLEVVDEWNETHGEHPLSTAGKTANDLLFFDTETTGLHGGAGNTIFLLGCSRIQSDQVQVKQYFLPGPHAEIALYQAFLNDVKDVKDIVTFNGKSFDWPQVKTRHTLIRQEVPDLPLFGHFDLLHGARRLWKNHLESCRLSMIEQEILGIKRKEDTPGHLAPILYFDYLRENNPELIKGVLDHNELDILSLITLYVHISRLLLTYGGKNCSNEERFEIGKWYEFLGQYTPAIFCYQQIAKQGGPSVVKAKLALANLYKKQKELQKAVLIWEQLCTEMSIVPAVVYIELAKVYEHNIKDNEKALFYAKQAYESVTSKTTLLKRKNHQEREAFLNRVERLEKKTKISSALFEYV